MICVKKNTHTQNNLYFYRVGPLSPSHTLLTKTFRVLFANVVPTYNQNLSIERAKTVKSILVKFGIDSKNIKIIGKGENDLRVNTNDEIAHPANRRAEISPLN